MEEGLIKGLDLAFFKNIYMILFTPLGTQASACYEIVRHLNDYLIICISKEMQMTFIKLGVNINKLHLLQRSNFNKSKIDSFAPTIKYDILTRCRTEESLNVLIALEQFFRKYLREKNVKVIFGEKTISFQIILYHVAKDFNIPFYTVMGGTIPKFMFYLYDDLYDASALKFNTDKVNKLDFSSFDDVNTYNLLKSKLAFPRISVKNNFNYKNISILKRVFLRFTNRVKEITAEYFAIKDSSKVFEGNYVVFFSQTSPESNLDWSAFEFRDQYHTLLSVIDTLPVSTKLILRLHPYGKNVFTPSQLLYLRSRYNVLLAINRYSINDIRNDDKCVAAFTISGNIAVQLSYAGFTGKIYVFTKIFKYNFFDNIYMIKKINRHGIECEKTYNPDLKLTDYYSEGLWLEKSNIYPEYQKYLLTASKKIAEILKINQSNCLHKFIFSLLRMM